MNNKKMFLVMFALLIGFTLSCNRKTGKKSGFNGGSATKGEQGNSVIIKQPSVDGQTDSGTSKPDDLNKKDESLSLIPPETREVRRLTAIEYVNTMQNIFDIDISSELTSFPLEGSVYGFQNSADAFSAGPSQIEWFSSTAKILGERVLEKLAQTLPETCLNGKDFACAKAKFDEYKYLLLRGESDPYTEAILQRVEKNGLAAGTVGDVFKEKLEVLVQLPKFLYILPPEVEGTQSVYRDDNDLVTRLSLTVWKSLPDEVLLNSVTQGNFSQNYASHVEKVLSSPRAREGFRLFAKEWLYLDRLDGIEASPGYEHITDTLISTMEQETLDFFETIAFDPNKDFMDIFKDNPKKTYPELENNIYSVDVEGNKVSKENTRSGYLSQASFLTLTSLLNNTDPVARGHYVSKVFFCVQIPNPQLGVTPLEEETEYTTKKQRYEAHSKNQPCAGCHIHMDRVGFAFENYDKSGRFRNIDEYNTKVDASGMYKFFDETEVPFKDFEDFNKKLSESEKVRECLVKRSMEHALGFEVDYESEYFKEIYSEYLKTNKSYIELLKTILNSKVFKKVAGS